MKLISLNFFSLLNFLIYLVSQVELLKNFSPSKISHMFRLNKFIYDLTDNFKKKDMFREKTLKIIKKLNDVNGIKLYLIVLPNANSYKYKFANLQEFSEDLFKNLEESKNVAYDTIILTISNKEKNCDLFFADKKVHFSEEELEKLKYTFQKDVGTGGTYYSTFYLLKTLYSRIVDSNSFKLHHRHSVNFLRGENSDDDKGEMIKSLFLLPILILICYSYFSGKGFTRPQKHQIDLSKIKIEKKDLKEMIDKNCIICLEDFIQKTLVSRSDSETILLVKDKQYNNKIMQLPCGHFFHPTCIVKWMHKQKTCPTCRKDVELETINLFQIEDKC
jgi:hypothetical protein